MDSFYEIIQKLKNKPEKKKFGYKKIYRIRLFTILIFSFLTISGLSLIFLTSYIKKNFRLTENYQSQFSLSKPEILSKTSQPTQISVSKESVTKKTDFPLKAPTLKPLPYKSYVKIPPGAEEPLSFEKKVPKTSAESKSHIEDSPIEGFILTKEDLLNNLLIIAEEERKKGNCEKAIFHYQSYLKEKENPFVMNNYGACLVELGKLDEAINIFNKALSIKNDQEIKYNLIIAYFKKGDKEKACKELKSLDSFYQEKFKEFCK